MIASPDSQVPSGSIVPDEIERFAHPRGRTKGQSAYIAAPHLRDALQAARERRIKILKSGGREIPPAVATSEAIAERLGVSRRLVLQAVEIHRIFDGSDGEALRREWEPKILDPLNSLGLGTVLKAIANRRMGSARDGARRRAKHVCGIQRAGEGVAEAPRQSDREAAAESIVLPQLREHSTLRIGSSEKSGSESINRLLLQRGLTKGQLAFLAFPHLEPQLQAARDRRLKVLRSGGRGSFPEVASQSDIAARLGISVGLLDQARRIHDEFRGENGDALRGEWEPKILDPRKPMGLKAVLDAIEEQRARIAAPDGASDSAAAQSPEAPAPDPSNASEDPMATDSGHASLPEVAAPARTPSAPLVSPQGTGSAGRATQQKFWPDTRDCVARGIVEEGGSIEAQVADSVRWGLEYAKSVPAFPVYSLVALVPVARLEIHPMAAQLPVMASPVAPKMPRRGTGTFAWEAPLVVTRTFKIVDGRQRYWSALAGRQEAIPCTFVKEEHTAAAMLIGILGRHHLSRGQVAYLCSLILAGEHRAIRTQSTGDRLSPHSGHGMGSSAGHLVRCLKSVLRTYFQNAEWLLSLFDSEPGLRQNLEPAILRDQKPLPLLEALRIARRHAESASDSGPWWNGSPR